MRNSRNHERLKQVLRDRQDYRRALIQKREELELKIKKVEADIEQLRGAA